MKIAIVGGGMSVLGTAYELSRCVKRHEIVIFESSPKLGGLSDSFVVNGVKLERFYHHLFPNYHDIFILARELGIGDKIFFKKIKTANFYNGKMFSFCGPLDLMLFSPITFFDRLKTGFWTLYLRFKKNWSVFEYKTASDWIRSHFGESSYNVLWGRLLESKFASLAKNIGMVWMWAKIFERPSRVGYFNGGFDVLIDAIQKKLENNGVVIKTNTTAPSTAELFKTGYDSVIIATPHETLLHLASGILPQEYEKKIQMLEYRAVICTVIVLRHHLTQYYWTNVLEKDAPFVGIIEQTNLVDDKTYHGFHPVYLTRYISSNDSFYQQDDGKILDTFLKYLKKIIPSFKEEWVEESYVFRAPYAQHVAPVGYGDIKPSFRTPIKNLWWVSMAHTYPWDRGINHSFRLGVDLARELLSKKQNYGAKQL